MWGGRSIWEIAVPTSHFFSVNLKLLCKIVFEKKKKERRGDSSPGGRGPSGLCSGFAAAANAHQVWRAGRAGGPLHYFVLKEMPPSSALAFLNFTTTKSTPGVFLIANESSVGDLPETFLTAVWEGVR